MYPLSVSGPASSAHPLFPRLGLALLSLALSLVAAELICRGAESEDLRAFFTPFEHDDSPYSTRVRGRQAADGTGLTLNWYVPGAEGVTGSVSVKINNLGLRDERDYPREPAPECFRVLVLGDSMTFGKGVREAESWPAVLEASLASSYPGRCIEVLNSGIPNTNFHIQWLHFLERWRGLEPDLVLVGFFVYNDSQLQEDRELYFPGWMATVDSTPVLKQSALIRLAYYRAFTRIGRQLVDERVPHYFDEDYPGWRQFQRSLADLQLVGLLDGFSTVVSLIPIPVGYDEYPFAELHERMRHFLEEERGIPTSDLLGGLSGVVAGEHWVHPSDGHPDPALHRLMGKHLARDSRWATWLEGSRWRPSSESEPGSAATALTERSGSWRLERPDGGGWASGELAAGRRTGPWLVVTPSAGAEQPGRVEWGSYQEDLREGLWTIRTSTWQEEGWQIYEEVGTFEKGSREGIWRATTSFKAHSSLEMQLSVEKAHAGPWRSEDQVSDNEEGRDEGAYRADRRAGRWSRWESQGRDGEKLVSVECLGDDGVLLWEWARGDAATEDSEEQTTEGSGVLTLFEALSPPENSDQEFNVEKEQDPASSPRALSADAVLSEGCPSSGDGALELVELVEDAG